MNRSVEEAMRPRPGWALAVLLAALMLLPGCAAVLIGAGAGVGVGTVKYVEGELEKTYSARVQQVWNASMRAVQQLEMRVVGSEKDAVGGSIDARRIDGTPVKLRVQSVGTNVTSVKVRVGTFGDREVSDRIIARIDQNLR